MLFPLSHSLIISRLGCCCSRCWPDSRGHVLTAPTPHSVLDCQVVHWSQDPRVPPELAEVNWSASEAIEFEAFFNMSASDFAPKRTAEACLTRITIPLLSLTGAIHCIRVPDPPRSSDSSRGHGPIIPQAPNSHPHVLGGEVHWVQPIARVR